MTNQSGVYQITFASSEKRYIGSSSNLEKRQNGHLNHLRIGVHANAHLQNAWNKYGESQYQFQTIVICDVANCVLYEQMVMDSMSERLYNIRPKAESNLGVRMSDEGKKRIADARTGKKAKPETIEKSRIITANSWRSGTRKPISNEARSRMNEANSARNVSAETRNKISAANTGRKQPREAVEKSRLATLGIKRTQEARSRMSVSAITAWSEGRHRGPITEETRDKQRAAQRGHPVSEEAREKNRVAHLGKICSEETRAKRSASMKRTLAKKKEVTQ